jgi:hypothetical protein
VYLLAASGWFARSLPDACFAVEGAAAGVEAGAAGAGVEVEALSPLDLESLLGFASVLGLESLLLPLLLESLADFGFALP